MTVSVLPAALAYCGRGWSVFPVEGKRPLVQWEPFQTSPAAASQIEAWWSQNPGAGVALALGAVSGVVRVDADGAEAVAEMLRLCGEFTSAEFTTPSGGRGWIFKHKPYYSTCVLWKGEGKHSELRVQSDGAYTVVPPSPGYEWVSEAVADLPAPLDEMLLQASTRKALEKLERDVSPAVCIPEKDVILEALKALDPVRCDDRDSWLQVGMALHSAGDEYFEHWDKWSRDSEKYKDGECAKLWAGFDKNGRVTVRTLLFLAKQDGWKPPDIYEPLTDVGNGRILARSCRGEAIYVAKWKKWLAWDGKRWKMDSELEVVYKAKTVVRQRYDRAVRSLAQLNELETAEKAEKVKGVSAVLKWCRASESAGRIHAAVDMARSEVGISVDHTRLDSAPWLLNCANGTLNLKTMELRPHDPNDYLTQSCPTEYWPEALCPRWDQFVDEIFAGDRELIEWVRKFLGFCLTGSVAEHVLPIFFGEGRNGKSTLIKTIISVLGSDYASTLPSGYLAAQRFEQHPTKIATLYGMRFVADLETSDGQTLDEALVKRLTGGDELKARRMNEDFWGFAPTHKLVLSTNYEPKVRGVDIAIWSRICLVPFTVSFRGREDTHLEEKLRGEASGILRWMAQGCADWQRDGLGKAKPVAQATEKYRGDQDTVSQFFSERCEKSEGSKVKKNDLVTQYKAWCYSSHCDPVSPKAFGLSMQRLGIEGEDKFYLGVKLT